MLCQKRPSEIFVFLAKKRFLGIFPAVFMARFGVARRGWWHGAFNISKGKFSIDGKKDWCPSILSINRRYCHWCFHRRRRRRMPILSLLLSLTKHKSPVRFMATMSWLPKSLDLQMYFLWPASRLSPLLSLSSSTSSSPIFKVTIVSDITSFHLQLCHHHHLHCPGRHRQGDRYHRSPAMEDVRGKWF